MSDAPHGAADETEAGRDWAALWSGKMRNIFGTDGSLAAGVRLMRHDYGNGWDGKTCAPLVPVVADDPRDYVRHVSGYALAILPDGEMWTVDNDGSLMYCASHGQVSHVPAVADVLHRMATTDETQAKAVESLGGQN